MAMRHLHALALVAGVVVLACPGPEPHLRTGTGGTAATGPGGAGGGGQGGGGQGGGGTCHDGHLDPCELCFEPLASVTDATKPSVGAILDFDGDGDLDVSGIGEGKVYVFENGHAGTSLGELTATDTGSPYGFGRPGQYTADNLPDDVVGLNGEIFFRRNQGGLDYGQAISLGVHGPITKLVSGDIDGNGIDDLIALRCNEPMCSTPGAVWPIWIADGTNMPFTPAPTTTILGDPGVGDMVLLDDDPRRDLVTLDLDTDQVHVYLNDNGALPNAPDITVDIIPPGQDPNGLAVADVAGIGHAVVITHGKSSNAVAVMKPDRASWIHGSVPVGGPQFSPNLVDMDGDGDLDLVVGVVPDGGGDFEIVVACGNGDDFDPPKTIAKDSRIAKQMVVGDLDEDGAPDVVIRSNNTTGILVLMSDP